MACYVVLIWFTPSDELPINVSSPNNRVTLDQVNFIPSERNSKQYHKRAQQTRRIFLWEECGTRVKGSSPWTRCYYEKRYIQTHAAVAAGVMYNLKDDSYPDCIQPQLQIYIARALRYDTNTAVKDSPPAVDADFAWARFKQTSITVLQAPIMGSSAKAWPQRSSGVPAGPHGG